MPGMAPQTTTGRPRGRTPALTNPAVTARLFAAVEAGLPLGHAAAVAGVHRATLHRWMARGQDELDKLAEGGRPQASERPYRDFCDRLTRARATVAERSLGRLERAARGGFVTRRIERTYTEDDGKVVKEVEEHREAPAWRVDAWLLEKSFPGDFGRSPERVEVTGPGGGPVQVSDERLALLTRRLAEYAEAERRPAGELPPAG